MLNESQLQELENFAYRTFTVRQIALILEVDEDELRQAIDTTDSPEYKAYNKGKLLIDTELRQSEIELALRGHSDAQRRVRDYINQQNQSDI